jgi:lycopene cyclase domain-containing protein
MTIYTAYNLILAALILPFSYWLAGRDGRRRNLLLSARIALLLTVLLYPWDFFAIRLGSWTYPNFDGWRIYGVPLNDSPFIWLCSYLTCVVLIRLDNRRAPNHGNSVGEEADG